jgi:hypothetical protein
MFGFGKKERVNTSNNQNIDLNKVLPFIDAVGAVPVRLGDGFGGYLVGRGKCGQGSNFFLKLKDGDLGVDEVVLPSLDWGAYVFHPDPIQLVLGHGVLEVSITSTGEVVPWGTHGLGTPAMMSLSGQLKAAKDRIRDLENEKHELITRLAQGEDNRNNLSEKMGIKKVITEKEEEDKNKKK